MCVNKTVQPSNAKCILGNVFCKSQFNVDNFFGQSTSEWLLELTCQTALAKLSVKISAIDDTILDFLQLIGSPL